MKSYEIGEAMSNKDVKDNGGVPSLVRIVQTGDFRSPRKGEWYISGAIPEGYKAPSDLSSPYFIGKLVGPATA